MGNIVLLDELTINKIAAGEVIERPASVVKEMLENSIDAGSTSVNIEVQNGGISKIRISDNGKGIDYDDMLIAFERHATSKIRHADDLEYVRTMGFRGEALASIAAIARVEMISRTANSDLGYKVVVEAGNVIEEDIVAATVGTTITVEKLFFNTPVRYKFLKKDYTEAGYIEDVVKRVALVNTRVAIKLVNNGKPIIKTSGNGKLEDVIYGIYGRDIVDGLLPINYSYENIFINGVIGKPEIARSNRANQMFFVNNRFVKDKTLSAAVEQAMKGMLPIGKFPFLVINIDIDPKKVDVNVHPAKVEVRFTDESEIFKAVMYAIKETLLGGSLLGNNVSKEERRVESFNTKFDKNSIEQFKEEMKNYESNKTQSNFEQQVNEYKSEAQNVYSQGVNSINNKNNYNVNDFNQAASGYSVEAKNSFSEELSDYKVDDKEGVSQEVISENRKENVVTDNISMANDKVENNNWQNNNVENNKTEEVKPDYMKDSLYPFADLNRIQSEILKEIEEMPVILDDKEVNEIEEIRNKIYTSRGEEIPDKDVKVNVVKKEDTYEPQNFDDMYEKTFGIAPASSKKPQIIFETLHYADSENLSMFEKEDKGVEYKYIGTVFSTYIILEVDEEMYILDQHAAHERVMYEKVKDNYYNGDKDCQLMLLPDVVNLTHKEWCILRENEEVFEKAGFKYEEFGDNTVKLVGVPSLCMDMDTKSLFLDILDEIDNVARTERQEIEERFIATVACKAAVKANMHLEEAEVTTLLDTLMKLPNPFTCPHGRPTAIKMTKNEIEKKFSRR